MHYHVNECSFQIWDLRRSYDLYSGIPKPKYSIPYAGNYALNGYSSLLLDSSKTKLYAGCKGWSSKFLNNWYHTYKLIL